MTATLEKRGGKTKLSASEQAVVDEFASVIRQHPDMDPIALVRFFGISMGGADSRKHKLARALTRGLETRKQIEAAEGGSLSSEETARLLRISKTAVLERFQAGRLLGWREERLNAVRFPFWQFNDQGQVLTGIKDVLEILNQDEQLDDWGKILFFLQQKTSLDGQRPLDLLRAGRLREVCLAARASAE